MQTSFPSKIRIATRESALALWQAEHVAEKLQALVPNTEISLIKIKTKGDKLLDSPLNKIGGKGLFIKELEVAMLEGKADLAVHSMKDVGVHFPDDFCLASILKRENPFDAFVSNQFGSLDDLPIGAKVGTCSLRRKMQIMRHRPDLTILDLRGNVQTRLRKLDDGNYDAIILACAGLIRLGLGERITQQLPAEISLPAVGQGAVGIECPKDSPLLALFSQLEDSQTALTVNAERIINERLEGSCQIPIAAYATLDNQSINLTARIGSPDASKFIEFSKQGSLEEASVIAHQVSDYLIDNGALDIIKAL